MTVSLFRLLAAAAITSCLMAAPAAAQTSATAAATKPLKLKNHQRKPVASSATRIVQKKDGEHAKVSIKRRAKKSAVAATPSAVPESLSPVAAQAFAAYELARVRVVTAEETGGARGLARAAIDPATVIGVDQVKPDEVKIVSAHDVNDLDRKADSPAAVSLDALSRDLAGSRDNYLSAAPKADTESWLQRLLMLFGGAFAAVAALVRTLLG